LNAVPKDGMYAEDVGLNTGARNASALCVVVVTYNSAGVLADLLDSLPSGLAGIEKTQIFVVDNASTDKSIEIAIAHPVKPRVIAMGRNAGYAAGINAAARFAGANDVLLILNPDMRLMPGAAQELMAGLSKPRAGVAVPRLCTFSGELSHSIRREPSIVAALSEGLLGGRLASQIGTGEIVLNPSLYENGGSIDWASGAAIAVSPDARRQVGEWDESFFLYSEEVDYLRNVRDAGFNVVYVPNSIMMHVGGDYQSNPRLSALMAANRIRYFRRHHGPVASFAYRATICLSSAIRSFSNPSARAMLQAALTPWRPPAEAVTGLDITPIFVDPASSDRST
jgi:GT2 family glycosyltransferase